MPPVHAPDLEAVGRRGTLVYECERDGPRTVLTRSSCTSPWHYVPPTYLDDSGCACLWLVNPSGGLAGGDQVAVEARLHAGTHVLLTSPSANRVYRSLSEPAVQDIRLSVGPGARLEWLPEVTIPFAGARFRQSMQVDLAPGATVVLWDAMAAGRIAMPERWQFAEYGSEMVVRTAAGGLAVERYTVTGEAAGAIAGAWNYVGTLCIAGDTLGRDCLSELAGRLHQLCERQSGSVLGGVSEPAVPGLVVKVVAYSAPALATFLASAWEDIRACLWRLPVPLLRRY